MAVCDEDGDKEEDKSAFLRLGAKDKIPRQEDGRRHLGRRRSWPILHATCTVGVLFVVACLRKPLVHWIEAETTSRQTHVQDTPTWESVDLDVNCDRTKVDHISECPELTELLPTLIENKRALLRLSLDALTGASQKSPMMLTTPLLLETADVLYSPIKHHSWSEDHRGTRFADWVENFHRTELGGRRPVLIYVAGGEVCSLLKDLVEPPVSTVDGTTSSQDGPGEDVVDMLLAGEDVPTLQPVGNTPLVLMTIGWDATGSPFTHGRDGWATCSRAILDLPQVTRWFVSHENGDYIFPKVEYLGIGFGGSEPRSGLTQSTYLAALSRKLGSMDSCPNEEAGSFDLLFMCNNNASGTPRPAINAALARPAPEGSDTSAPVSPKVIPTNRYPMEPEETLVSSMDGFFAVSPPGTRPDCFRHYEYLLAGNIVYVPGTPTLRRVLYGLPVVFVEGGTEAWGKLTCDVMAGHAKEVARRLKHAQENEAVPPFQFAKLTLEYWKFYLMNKVQEIATAMPVDGTSTTAVSRSDENMVFSSP